MLKNWSDYWKRSDFCKDSQLWSLNAELFLRRVHEFIEFKNNDSVLNIGCGPGYLELFLAPTVKDICAMDISEQYTDLTRKRCKNYNNVSVLDVAEDYTDLSVCRRNFSIITCISVVQYYKGIQEIEALISSAQKIACRNAKMLIADLPLKRNKSGFLWDILCSCYAAICGGYALKLIKVAFEVYHHKFQHRNFHKNTSLLYFTDDELESLIKRMGINGRVIRKSFSVYANRSSLLIYLNSDINLDQTVTLKPCCLCGRTNFKKIISDSILKYPNKRFGLIECKNCRLIRSEPAINDSQLDEHYGLEYYNSAKKKFIYPLEKLTYYFNYKLAHSLSDHLYGHINGLDVKTPRILDIGCGRGNLLKILQRMHWECYGIERKSFPADNIGNGIHFYKKNLDNIAFADNFFDGIIMWYALEHMADMSILKKINKIIRSKGILVLSIPNTGSLQFKLFGADWFHLDLPRHVHHFNVRTITKCLKKSGFNIVSLDGCSIEQSMFGFIQSCFNKMFPFVKANSFFSLLKKHSGFLQHISLISWSVLALMLLPYAFVEYALLKMSNASALVEVYAQKP